MSEFRPVFIHVPPYIGGSFDCTQDEYDVLMFGDGSENNLRGLTAIANRNTDIDPAPDTRQVRRQKQRAIAKARGAK